MYSVYSYGQMLMDTPRLQAYLAALRLSVKPGTTFMDLGCGPGLFALLACQLGARHVYAVEPDNIIQVATEAAIAQGYAEKIQFFQNFSTNITLPERVDVIVSDLRGVLPWYQRHIPSILDARNRLLAPGGILIPQRDVVWAALVELPDKHDELTKPWERSDVDLSLMKRLATNSWRKTPVKPEYLLTTAKRVLELDYNLIEGADLRADLEWQASRSGTAHGFAVWFDSELIGDISFSNAPGNPQLIYGQAFFPFPEAVEIEPNDQIRLLLSADLVRDDYMWRWETNIVRARDSISLAHFKQSTIYGVPLSPTQLRKQSAVYRPALTERGEIRRFILNSMNEENSLEEIATRLVEQFPRQYLDPKAALDDVAAVSLEFAK